MKVFFRALLFSVIVMGLSSCSLVGGELSEKEMSVLNDRIAKLEADVLSIKFELGMVDFNDVKVEAKDTVTASVTESVTDSKTEEVVAKDEVVEEKVVEEKPSHTITLSKPEDESLVYKAPIDFTGTVSAGAKKITVTATSTSGKDVYVLQNFKAGEESFWYKADTTFGNLDDGSNEFLFEATFDDDTTASSSVTVYYLHN